MPEPFVTSECATFFHHECRGLGETTFSGNTARAPICFCPCHGHELPDQAARRRAAARAVIEAAKAFREKWDAPDRHADPPSFTELFTALDALEREEKGA